MMFEFLENPVFICGHRKTGTTMLINLFDNSPDAIVYPDDSSFFYMYYPRYEDDRFSKNEKIARIRLIIDEQLRGVIDEHAPEDVERLGLHEKHRQFCDKALEEIIESDDFSIKNVLKTTMKYLHLAFTPENRPKVWLEKTTSTEIYALDLIKMFPNAKFIHLIRDPRDNWASLKSGWNEKYHKFNDEQNRLLQSLIERGKLGLEFAKYNQEVIGNDRYKVVRFEDLTKDPDTVLKELAKFTGIEYTDNLLYPTRFGIAWGGNNFEGAKFKKPSSQNANRWKERISNEEAQLIEYYFADIMRYFDYDLMFTTEDRINAAKEFYKWSNFSSQYSAN